ncbi:hypothetical protein MLD38_004828 [Melastoma candidum]|uniref:Uncharacterized protein n=1 Tax=Melastoma candidum TaxID=119954 RepID=A0ACB9S6G4_9MYRT|nr:hypothetical protein MLD38_004828 [Melastoma candidum]
MAPAIPSISDATTPSQVGLGVMTIFLCAFVLFKCVSHSRRRYRHWQECYGFFEEEPVIQVVNNESVVYHATSAEEEMNHVSVWQKNIIMGGKCQLPDFSGVIIYDADGKIVCPTKTRE